MLRFTLERNPSKFVRCCTCGFPLRVGTSKVTVDGETMGYACATCIDASLVEVIDRLTAFGDDMRIAVEKIRLIATAAELSLHAQLNFVKTSSDVVH